jgi:hypothetical protein
MAGIIVALNLNNLTCDDTCVGPGSDQISLTYQLDDITQKALPVNITKGSIGPFEMDTKKNVNSGKPGVFQLGPRPLFKAMRYSRVPPTPGAAPDVILLTVTLVKGDAVVTLDIPVEVNFQGARIGITIPVGKGIAKIVDLFESQIIGTGSDTVDNKAAAPPNGQKFDKTYTGNGSKYGLSYSLTAEAF